MHNLIESIKALKEDKNMKENFLNEFDLQINTLNTDEKEKNYRTFIEDDEMLEFFFDKFDYDFIINNIARYIKQSNTNQDLLSQNIYKNLDKIVLKKSKENSADENIKTISNTFGDLLENNFYNTTYNQNSPLYLWLMANPQTLNIILYIFLSCIKDKEYNEIINIKSDFNKLLNANYIYQYIPFKSINSNFWEHILKVSFFALFTETANRSFQLKHENNRMDNYNIQQVFSFSNDINKENYQELLLIIKDFWLLHNLLRKLKDNVWIDEEYRKKVLNTLLEFDIIENNDLVNFCILFCAYDDIKITYTKYITWIKINNKHIMDNLKDDNNWFINDTIKFVMLDENKHYLDKSITDNLIEKLKDKLILNVWLDEIFSVLYTNFIDGNLLIKNLDLTFNQFGKQLISNIINNKTDEKLLFALKNIDKILLKDDMKAFNKQFVSELIDDIANINYTEFYNIFKLINKIEKEELDKISLKMITNHLRNSDKLKIYLELLTTYNRPFHFNWLKENIENIVKEDQDEEVKNILKEILKKIK